MLLLIFFHHLSGFQDPKAPGSPTSLRVPPAGPCDDLDMETEEEDELRARGLTSLMSGVQCISSACYTVSLNLGICYTSQV